MPSSPPSPARNGESADDVPMIALIWRALFLWRLWRAFNRSRYAQRLARRAWDLHSRRWVARTKD